MSYRGIPPPPAYSAAVSHAPSSRCKPTLLDLPDHLILQILSYLDLPTLVFTARTTCRKLWLYTCSLTRQLVWPAWRRHVQPGNTTDAASWYGDTSIPPDLTQRTRNILADRSREQAVLDLFVSASALHSLRTSESQLLIESLEQSRASQDIFGHLQPRARVEDLVIAWGIDDKILFSSNRPGGGGTIQAEDLSVQLMSKTAKVMLPMASSNEQSRIVQRVVLEVPKENQETLEITAERVVRALRQLRVWREETVGKDGVSRGYYERA